MPMVDIAEVVKGFFDAALKDQMKLHAHDVAVIAALQNPDDVATNDAVIRWLKLYRVLRIKKNTHRPIARAILRYADAFDWNAPALQGDEILRAYNDLHQAVRRVGPKKKDGAKRELASLTSKALWCFSPDTVPIYDSRALNAVITLSRLSKLPMPKTIDYSGYVGLWQRLYKLAEPTIDAANRDGYPYKARIFDKILWLIG